MSEATMRPDYSRRVHQLVSQATAAPVAVPGANAKISMYDAKKGAGDGLITRELQAGDYHRGFISLLGQLTTAGEVSEKAFLARLAEMNKADGVYKIAVIIDPEMNLVIACATLLIEKKFVHSLGKVGHVEDVVVNSTYRGRQLGLRVVDQLKTWAQEAGCYKIILDCAAHNVPFYNKLGFVKKEEQMACYFKA